jgi:signal transduction histidine kinase
MAHFSQLAALSPLPIVDLSDIKVPTDGLWLSTSSDCRKNFSKDSKCAEHYASLVAPAIGLGECVQCPYGFSSIAFRAGSMPVAITGYVPYPRSGGEAERRAAKANKVHKKSIESVSRAATALLDVGAKAEALERSAVQGYSMALHEIRKLNRTVKQTAERLCRAERPDDPELANTDLVQIWKSADLMSTQFDIIELLANESLTQLPINSTIELYRIVDKCVRIYRPADAHHRLQLRTAPGFTGRIAACDKTFAIIPTVLIENALKYAIKDTSIVVDVYTDSGQYALSVSNDAVENKLLNDQIFEKGRRAAGGDGSGHGLYLAQLVAKQHHARIKLSVRSEGIGIVRCAFTVKFAPA